MRLHGNHASPFTRKARAVIVKADLSGEVDLVVTKGTPLESGTHPTALNPLSKIPTLERPDGPAIFDSRVITRFLDAHAMAGLYPEPPRLWATLTLEALADGMMEATLAIVYESRFRDETLQMDAWKDAQWGKVTSAMRTLEERWLSHLEGPFDMAHIAVGCALGYVDFRLGDRDWRAGHPSLAEWYARISTRPCLAETEPHD